MEFIAATQNAGKLKELRRILEKMGHTIISQRDAGCDIDVDETGTTFAENALLKAEAICKASGKPTIADDSGIAVDFLNGEPGIYSARYCGRHGDDEANIDKLLQNMQGVEQEKRGAQYVSVVAVYLPNGSHITAQGICKGWVGYERRGTNGFGYDPVFNIPLHGDKSYAEITDEEKDKISHRGQALLVLQKVLPDFLKTKNKCAASAGIIGGNNVK